MIERLASVNTTSVRLQYGMDTCRRHGLVGQQVRMSVFILAF